MLAKYLHELFRTTGPRSPQQRICWRAPAGDRGNREQPVGDPHRVGGLLCIMNNISRALDQKMKEGQPTLEVQTHSNGGIQKLYKFRNGMGASVVMFPGSYGFEKGLWELAVLDPWGNITYDTPITSDVIGYLDENMVNIILERIKKL